MPHSPKPPRPHSETMRAALRPAPARLKASGPSWSAARAPANHSSVCSSQRREGVSSGSPSWSGLVRVRVRVRAGISHQEARDGLFDGGGRGGGGDDADEQAEHLVG